jgi:molybdopterin molybdotransferase
MTGSPPLPDYDEALHAALSCATPLIGTESVALHHAACRILAEPVVASRDLPPFNRAAMDGYALRAADYQRDTPFDVVGEIAAGARSAIAVPPGACVKISTGAPLPDDVDAVIPHERSDRSTPVRFTADAVTPGQSVHPRSADARAGDVLLRPGSRLAAHHLGIAASAERAALTVRSPVRTTLLTSGDEVRPPGSPLESHQIANSNAPQTIELLRRFGAAVIAHTHLTDDVDPVRRALADAIEMSDLVVTIGGISAGEHDHFKTVLVEQHVDLAVRGAAIQPGKPIHIGRAPRGTVVVCLPGNPVSALACGCLFLQPIMNAMLGCTDVMRWRTVRLAAEVRPNAKRTAFRPAILDADDRLTVPRWAGSGDIVHTAKTTGLARLPRQDATLPAGRSVPYLPWP